MRVSNVTVRRRLVIALIVGLFVFAVVVVRLGYVQLVMGSWLSEKAKDSWSRNIPFEPSRGEILDRNGVALATNVSAPSVLIVPRQLQNPASTAEALAASLNTSKEKVYETITQNESMVCDSP